MNLGVLGAFYEHRFNRLIPQGTPFSEVHKYSPERWSIHNSVTRIIALYWL
jgi:hypothetical protein